MSKALNTLAVVSLCVAAAVAYGIVHDQFTVRICEQYFTVFHPNIFGHQSPTMLTVLWGTVATWWVGAFLGLCLAVAACWGKAPMQHVGTLFTRVINLLVVMGILATVCGAIGYLLTTTGAVPLDAIYAQRLPESMHARFVADAYAHNASYISGLAGGSYIIVKVWKQRKRLATRESS